MYNCELCWTGSEPKQPRLLYRLYRTEHRMTPTGLKSSKQIEKEIPVCRECDRRLQVITLAARIQEIKNERFERQYTPRRVPQDKADWMSMAQPLDIGEPTLSCDLPEDIPARKKR